LWDKRGDAEPNAAGRVELDPPVGPEPTYASVMSSGAPTRLVVLVDAAGNPIDDMEVVAAHTLPGHAHLACSAVVFGPNDTVLMQRRADHKPTFGGRWSNTCCTHPYPGEAPHEAAERRMREEIGFATPLRPVGSFRYRAVDPITELVEHEFDHVSVATLDSQDVTFLLDENEVAEVGFVPVSDVLALQSTPLATPWLEMVLRIALSGRDA
jgi:isopentenyl-diphosphate Delta-isomerase